MSREERAEVLSNKANERIWAEEAERRDRDWDANPAIGISAAEVFREARARLSRGREEL